MRESFEHLKIGDEVAFLSSYGDWIISKIVSETKTRWTTKVGWSFRKKDGRLIGSEYQYARLVTDKIRKSVRLRLLQDSVGYRFDCLRSHIKYISPDYLKKLDDLLSEVQEKGLTHED